MLSCSSSAQSQCGSTVTHTPKEKLKEICGSTDNNITLTHTLSQRKERRIQSLEGQILLLMMMMIIIIMIGLIITQSAAIIQSSFCFVPPPFFNMGTPSISKFSYCCHSVSSSSLSLSLPFASLPFPSLLPFASKTTLCPAHRVVQHKALGS